MALKARFLILKHFSFPSNDALFIYLLDDYTKASLSEMLKKQQNSYAPGSGVRFLSLCLSGSSGLFSY